MRPVLNSQKFVFVTRADCIIDYFRVGLLISFGLPTFLLLSPILIELSSSLEVLAMLFWRCSLNDSRRLIFFVGLVMYYRFELMGRRNADLRSVRRIVIKV